MFNKMYGLAKSLNRQAKEHLMDMLVVRLAINSKGGYDVAY
ncbi:hypothetical protein Acife_2975 [Acidithiobacillus ferrivorans SS3]|uniref:Uncharacterized protein n=1 Tax=Acidithiobacillus ferrivorans SS3 TaxID=743299 RepID=G0JTT4_9PROT|nr:hypothetical protein Acife_2975 [Acidithiobacillus ferrivorans SS3]